MKNNEFAHITIKCDDRARIALKELYITHPQIYSYILFYRDNEYIAKFNYCSRDKYNGINTREATEKLMTYITANENHNNVICFGQSPLATVIEVFTPYYNKLANQILAQWQCYEFDDLVQMCILCVCTLYSKGYYLHKRLIERTLINMVLVEQRKTRCVTGFVSFDTMIGKDQDQASLLEIIPDEHASDEFDNIENDSYKQYRFKRLKELFPEMTERQWQQLIFEYNHNITTHASVMKVKNIRDRVEKCKKIFEE